MYLHRDNHTTFQKPCLSLFRQFSLLIMELFLHLLVLQLTDTTLDVVNSKEILLFYTGTGWYCYSERSTCFAKLLILAGMNTDNLFYLW
jgi:hypothetical protein